MRLILNRYGSGIIVLALVIMIGVATYAVPWRMLVTERLQQMASQSFGQPVRFTLQDFGLYSSALENVAIGDTTPLLVQQLRLTYTPRELWHGRLQNITITGLPLTFQQAQAGWELAELQGQKQQEPADSATPFTMLQQLTTLPVTALQLNDSNITVKNATMNFAMPLSVTWDNSDTAKVSIRIPHITGMVNQHAMNLQDLFITANKPTLEKAWRGTWHMKAWQPPPAMMIPTLKAKGTMVLNTHQLLIKGDVASGDQAWKTRFQLTQPWQNNAPVRLQLETSTLPWLGGIVTIKPFKLTLPLSGEQTVTVAFRGVSLPALLKQFAGDKARGTGTISGTTKLTRTKNGQINIDMLEMAADSTGQLSLPAEFLPGDQAQIALVRSLLADLHYSLLSLTGSAAGGGGQTLKLTLAGNNPAVEQGKPVNLNVNLSGDVLDLIKQNLLLFSSPQNLVAPRP